MQGSIVEICLPITGMLSRADAQRLENSLLELPGILQARVDPVVERAHLVYNLNLVNLFEIEITINEAGLCLPNVELSIPILEADSLPIPSNFEERLEREAGILLATVDNTKDVIRVQYIKEVITAEEVRGVTQQILRDHSE